MSRALGMAPEKKEEWSALEVGEKIHAEVGDLMLVHRRQDEKE